MRRRTFIAGLGSTAAWPLATRAQQREHMRRVGVLMGFEENDLEAKTFLSAFTQSLAELSWIDGGNVRIDYRWGASDLDRFRRYAAELVALGPDVVVATAASIVLSPAMNKPLPMLRGSLSIQRWL